MTFHGDGEMPARFRDTDWASTPLGAMENWPELLRVSVGLCLNSRFPLILWWGPELTMLYNDSYIGHLQGKHPKALGKPGRDVWTEIWSVIGPMLDGVWSTGNATYSDDLQLFLERNGYPEETYHTFSYSAIRDSEGKIVGIFTPVAETTERVISERRLSTLSDLARTKAETEQELLSKIGIALQSNKMDLPLCAFYSLDTQSSRCDLLASNAENERTVEYLRNEELLEKLIACAKAGSPTTVDDLKAESALLPKSMLGFAPSRAVVVPVPTHKANEWLLFLAAVSPHKALNDTSITFFESVARSIATALRDARAYEHERRKLEALEELDRAKTAFFNNVSHEFRTPLTLMLGPLDRILARARDTEDQAELEIVQRNSLRLLKLVNTLLDFSRFQAGRNDARFEQTNLNVFTTDLVSLFRSAVENAGLSLEVNCASLTENAYVDQDMWEKIVLNLVSNAFKFTLAGTIKVILEQTEKDFVLSVADTGAGIPLDELENIFKRFYRVKAETARTYEGSGIGLSLVSELVQLHHGKITVKSTSGKGSVFTVTIPRGFGHLPEDAIVTGTSAAPRSKHGKAVIEEVRSWSEDQPKEAVEPVGVIATHHILIVDDNADMRSYLLRLLEPLCSAEAVSNGKAALEAIAKRLPDLIVSDIMMPDIDGFALVRKLRETKAYANVPVIFLSARAGDEARAEGIEAGADDYLVKPFTARELYARVNRQLQQRMVALSLEEAVRQRTRDLEAALQSKSRFLATVSHEVRTPLSGMLGLIELILTSAENEDTRLMAKTALDASQRLLCILNDLLDASKLQAGKVELEFRNFALRPVIGDIVQLIKPEADKKKLAIVSLVDQDVPANICGDELRLRQVLLNLAFNAVKFTEKGTISISVKLLEQKDRIMRLGFEINDTGIGISEENLDKLFEPFAQAADSTTRLFGGTGLGLNISQTLTTLMQGEITVQSTLGRGTTFIVSIPFNEDRCNITRS